MSNSYSSLTHAEQKKILRKQMRIRRRLLSKNLQTQYSNALCFKIFTSTSFKKAKKIGFYLASDGEISLAPLLKIALLLGKECFFPVIKKHGSLDFLQFNRGDKLTRNKYRILEPQKKAKNISPKNLDLVFMPLVAFREDGSRLGMGGGYYDRTFCKYIFYNHKYDSQKKRQLKPLLVGVAYDFQYCKELNREPWDVPVSMVFSNQKKYICR